MRTFKIVFATFCVASILTIANYFGKNFSLSVNSRPPLKDLNGSGVLYTSSNDPKTFHYNSSKIKSLNKVSSNDETSNKNISQFSNQQESKHKNLNDIPIAPSVVHKNENKLSGSLQFASKSTKTRKSMQRNNLNVRPIKYPLTFDDPSKYLGPTVLGWPPDKDRSIPLYLAQSKVMMEPRVLQGIELLIVVQTMPQAFDARMGIRNSWGKYLNEKVDVNSFKLKPAIIFLIGNSVRKSEHEVKDLDEATNNKLKNENKRFGDLLQVNLVEHYNNVTLKSMLTLKYFLDETRFGQSLRFLMKVDDDAFVNLPLLSKKLSHSTNQHLLIGSKLEGGNQLVHQVQETIEERKTFTEKWECPTYMYNNNVYPEFLSGCGYVMSKESAKCIFQEGIKLPFFHLEDVFITGFAAQQCRIPRREFEGFHSLPQNDIKQSDILIHYLNSSQMLDLFHFFEN